jgi:RNA polymerase sigma-70 factor (ECF subfamily)
MHRDRPPIAAEPNGDAALVERAQTGDHEAYAELVRRYSGLAHRVATMVAGPADAEDAVQDAFVRAYYALDRFRLDAPFKPWLLTIVTNAARNRVRSAGQQPRLRDRVGGDRALGTLHLVQSAEAEVVDEDERRALVAAINELPSNARAVVMCRYLLELTEAETAQVLGWPAGTVKSRLSRALDRLRADLMAGEQPEGGSG